MDLDIRVINFFVELNDRCGYHNCSIKIRNGNRIFILMDIIFFPKILLGLLNGCFQRHGNIFQCSCGKARRIRQEQSGILMNHQVKTVKKLYLDG